MSGGESRVLTSSGDIGQFLWLPMASRWFCPTPSPTGGIDAEADPNGDAAQRRAWLRGQEASGRLRRFTGPEFVGEEELADAPVDRQLVRFDLTTQASLVLTPDVGDYAEPRFLPSQQALVCSGRIDPESDPPSAEIVGCGRFLWTAAARRCCCNDQAPFCRRLVLREMAICWPSPNWTLPMSPTPHCVWGLGVGQHSRSAFVVDWSRGARCPSVGHQVADRTRNPLVHRRRTWRIPSVFDGAGAFGARPSGVLSVKACSLVCTRLTCWPLKVDRFSFGRDRMERSLPDPCP